MVSKSNIIQGDCLEEMQELEEDSIDSIVTDPPYALGFMGKGWDTFDKSQFGKKGEEGKEDLKVKKDFNILPRYDGCKPSEYQEFCYEWGKEALRVLKPGAYLLAFSGTRTYHRMVVGLEDAGFEIKDQIDWLYGSGFPKSHDISKAIDRKFLRERLTEKLGHKPTRVQFKQAWEYEREVVDYEDSRSKFDNCDRESLSEEELGELEKIGGEKRGKSKITKPATPEASKWDGWGTTLKPAHEPIVVAQKPREGTYAGNVLRYGVGGLNIDGCRIEANPNDDGVNRSRKTGKNDTVGNFGFHNGEQGRHYAPGVNGRWPANVVLDPQAAAMLDEQSGVSKSTGGSGKNSGKIGMRTYGDYSGEKVGGSAGGFGDSGGASRFFYCAKARKSERNAGLEDLENVGDLGERYGSIASDNPICKKCGKSKYDRGNGVCNCDNPEWKEQETEPVKNDIATLKPINLMRWLVRLVTSPDGTVLDPFAGSGTTGCACEIEGFDYILIEKRERFANLIAPKRCDYWSDSNNWDDLKEHNSLPEPIHPDQKKLEDL